MATIGLFLLVKVLLVCFIFFIHLDISAAYCKPGIKYFNRRRCLKCPKCSSGEFTNKTRQLVIDDKKGALNCYPCTPCPYGTYSNDEDTRIGRDIQCAAWLNCTAELNRTYLVFPNNVTRGQCGKCRDGYYPMIRDMNDSPCIACTLQEKDRAECYNRTWPSVVQKHSRGTEVKHQTSSDNAVVLGSATGHQNSSDNAILLGVATRHQNSFDTAILLGVVISILLAGIILAISSICLYNRRRQNRLNKKQGIRINESDQLPMEDLNTTINENQNLLQNDLKEDSGGIHEIKQLELSEKLTQLYKTYTVKLQDPIVRTLCSRSVLCDCVQYLCENLIPNRQDVLQSIMEKEQATEQCYTLVEKWLQIGGRSATMYVLYEAVYNVYKKCREQNNEAGAKLYKELLYVIQQHVECGTV